MNLRYLGTYLGIWYRILFADMEVIKKGLGLPTHPPTYLPTYLACLASYLPYL